MKILSRPLPTRRGLHCVVAVLVIVTASTAAGATEILRVATRFDGACGAGAAVAALSDVTGDGRPEVLVGAIEEDSEGCLGAAIVYDPALDRVLWKRTFRTDEHDGPRRSLVPLRGDLDGDGAEDVVAGAPFTRVDPTQPGPNQFGAAILVLSGRTGATIARLENPIGGERFGAVIAPAGDVDGDGVPDLLVGDPDRASRPGESIGSVRVISSADGREIARFVAPRAGEEFGAAVAAAGDVDGDGSTDFLIGAPNAASELEPLTGAVDVVSGQAGTALARLHGAANESIGVSVAPAGDADGDGRPDVLAAGSGGAVRCLSLDGRTLSVLTREGEGPVAIAGGFDATGDGGPDAIVGRPGAWGGSGRVEVVSLADGSVRVEFDAAAIAAGRGAARLGSAVAFGFDVDGEGTALILAGAPNASTQRVSDTNGAIVIARRETEIALRCGNVNRGAGAAADVLYVNDTAGDDSREIEVHRHVPVTIFMASPPASVGRAPFALFARLGRPGRADLRSIAGGLGTAVFPLPLGIATPGTRVIANGLPVGTVHASAPGPMRPEEPAPAIVARLPLGTRRSIVVALQGVIVDPASASPSGLSLSNAVILISP